jgi:hypothetical protein
LVSVTPALCLLGALAGSLDTREGETLEYHFKSGQQAGFVSVT